MTHYRLMSIMVFILVAFVGICYAEPLTASLIIGGATLLGSGIGAWFNYAGMKRQAAEDRRAEGVSIARDDAAIARSEKWAGKELGLKKEQIGMQKTQMDRDYATTTRSKLLQMLASNTQMANNMISIWRGRRTA